MLTEYPPLKERERERERERELVREEAKLKKWKESKSKFFDWFLA